MNASAAAARGVSTPQEGREGNLPPPPQQNAIVIQLKVSIVVCIVVDLKPSNEQASQGAGHGGSPRGFGRRTLFVRKVAKEGRFKGTKKVVRPRSMMTYTP